MKKLLTGLLAIAVIAGGAVTLGFVPAFATGTNTVTSTAADTDTEQNDATEAGQNDGEGDDSAVLAQAKLTQQQAEAQVKAANPQATIVGGELENENGAPVFSIKVQENNQNKEVKVDAVSGKVLKTELSDANEKESKDSAEKSVK